MADRCVSDGMTPEASEVERLTSMSGGLAYLPRLRRGNCVPSDKHPERDRLGQCLPSPNRADLACVSGRKGLGPAATRRVVQDASPQPIAEGSLALYRTVPVVQDGRRNTAVLFGSATGA